MKHLNLFELREGAQTSNHLNWEAHALGRAGTFCERASTDENNPDGFSFFRIPMTSRLRLRKKTTPFQWFLNFSSLPVEAELHQRNPLTVLQQYMHSSTKLLMPGTGMLSTFVSCTVLPLDFMTT